MSDAEIAFANAQEQIVRANTTGANTLDLTARAVGEIGRSLDRLPPEIAALTELHTIHLSGTQIADFAPLAGMTWLRVLNLSSTQITDLAPLASLTRLQRLYLGGTLITDFAPLAGMTSLQRLNLDRTSIADFAPLAGLTGLRDLILYETQITDLAPLAKLRGLQQLNIFNTKITDFAPLAALTRLRSLNLRGTQIADLAPLVRMKGLRDLNLGGTPIADLAPLVGMTGLQSLYLADTEIADLAPLAGLTALQTLFLANTPITDLAPLADLAALQTLNLFNTRITDLRPIVGLSNLGTGGGKGVSFEKTRVIERDVWLEALAQIEDDKKRTRDTLTYLQSLPPWPQPYSPADSVLQPIGGDTINAQAQALSELTPLAESLVQSTDTGRFSVQYQPIKKPDLLNAILAQLADAIEDVLQDPKNGLNETSLEIRKLKRTLKRFANDPQRIEMDFTTVHQSLTRQIAVGELPASEETLSLMIAIEQGAQGIRATHADVYVNRRILQEQNLRELSDDAINALKDSTPVLLAITEGDAHQQMQDDLLYLTEEIQAVPPRLPGLTRDDAINIRRDEAIRVFGRTARIMMALRKSPVLVRKLHQSTAFNALEIMAVLATLVTIGLTLF
ncbi:MAG: leucine-rich repeat domain-containing protein [Pseudotabrizicola sp.]|uniref:leucine-rich repeat domain-containing protein n=1 Tax=Pseudotabrizicola sp. TaxID=2939647 RepID=UPI0027287210|nr:leucine-rich repeat domain-containing protein [Pseudotabrizicola sp.]MDO9639809.1 leucine-rich repeat domain-containing protein [Pseudotabrizicola sp.]